MSSKRYTEEFKIKRWSKLHNEAILSLKWPSDQRQGLTVVSLAEALWTNRVCAGECKGWPGRKCSAQGGTPACYRGAWYFKKGRLVFNESTQHLIYPSWINEVFYEKEREKKVFKWWIATVLVFVAAGPCTDSGLRSGISGQLHFGWQRCTARPLRVATHQCKWARIYWPAKVKCRVPIKREI